MMKLKNILKRSKGNSLTFLLTSLAIMSLSLAVTSTALGPLFSASFQKPTQYSAIEAIAEHHLDVVEAFIENNPGVFAKPSNWNATSPALSGLPPAQEFSSGNTISPILSYQEYIYNGNANSPLLIQSNLPANSTGVSGLVRFNTFPYNNTILVTTQIQNGSIQLSRYRFVTLHPFLCATGNPQAMNAISYSGGTASTSDSILRTSGPFFQIGNGSIFPLPERTQGTATTTLTALSLTGTQYLIQGYRDTIASTEVSSYLTYSPTSGLNVGAFMGPSNVPNANPTLGSYAMTLPGTSPMNSISAEILHPIVGDAQNTYAAVVAYNDNPNQAIKMSWLRWSSAASGGSFSVSSKEGLPLGYSDTLLTSMTNANLKLVPAGDSPNSRMLIVASDSGLSAIPIQLQPQSTAGTSPYVAGTAINSTATSASSPSAFLQNSPQFGQVVASRTGDFVLAPAFDGSTNTLYVAAFNTQDMEVDNNNALGAANTSNIVPLMKFTGPTANLNTIKIWYNSENNKFYWITQNSSTLYEWDPATWGNLSSTTLANPNNLNNGLMYQLKRIAVIGAQSVESGFANTVRTISLSTWQWTTTAPQYAYNKAQNEYYLRSDSGIIRVPLNEGAYKGPNAQVAFITNASNSADPPGANMILEPIQGMLYFASNNQVWQFNTQDASTTASSTGISLTSSDGSANMIYSLDQGGVYFASVPSAGSVSLQGYQSLCYRQLPGSALYAMLSDIPAFQTGVSPHQFTLNNDAVNDAQNP